MVQVLDKGWVELSDHMASDSRVVKRARVSNVQPSLEATTESRTVEQDQKLINYLIKNRHGSPFEGSVFEFYVKCPLFVRSEWHRHRMASYNEMSGRYVEYEPEFYRPDKWRVQGLTNKQGSQFPEEAWAASWKERNALNFDVWGSYEANKVTKLAYETYKKLLSEGIAKEMARVILPPSLYTAFYMTVNARSLMNFLSLRNADNAQWEIRQYAIAMESMFEERMPLTYGAWVNNGRLAP